MASALNIHWELDSKLSKKTWTDVNYVPNCIYFTVYVSTRMYVRLSFLSSQGCFEHLSHCDALNTLSQLYFVRARLCRHVIRIRASETLSSFVDH